MAVRVHPGMKPVTIVSAEFNTLVQLIRREILQEFAPQGWAFAGNGEVLLKNEILKVVVGIGEQRSPSLGPREIVARGLAAGTVAACAAPIQNRLDHLVETKRPRTLTTECQFGRLLQQGQWSRWCGRCLLAILVATHTGESLARLHVGQRTHRLNGSALLVEGLEKYRHA